MAWITLDPITRRRFERFRRIKRGYYSLVILLGGDRAVDLRAVSRREPRAVRHGTTAGSTSDVPVLDMNTFGQKPPPGWGTGDLETEYLRLQREWQAERFCTSASARGRRRSAEAGGAGTKYPESRQLRRSCRRSRGTRIRTTSGTTRSSTRFRCLLDGGRHREGAERIARRDGLDELADCHLHRARSTRLLADPEQSPTGDLVGLARSGAMPSLGRAWASCRRRRRTSLRRHYFGHRFAGTRRRVAAALRLPHLDLLRPVPGPVRPGDRHDHRQPAGLSRRTLRHHQPARSSKSSSPFRSCTW